MEMEQNMHRANPLFIPADQESPTRRLLSETGWKKTPSVAITLRLLRLMLASSRTDEKAGRALRAAS